MMKKYCKVIRVNLPHTGKGLLGLLPHQPQSCHILSFHETDSFFFCAAKTCQTEAKEGSHHGNPSQWWKGRC